MPSSYAIGDYFEQFIRQQIDSGRYSSAREVVREALRGLEEIADYIAQDNPHRALSFIDETRTRCNNIVSFPEATVLRDNFGKGIRVKTFNCPKYCIDRQDYFIVLRY